MPVSAEDIVAQYQHRKAERGPVLARMQKVTQLYDYEITLPLPEVDAVEEPAVVNLAQQTIDQHGMRIASVMPNLSYPPRKVGNENAEEAARLMRDVNLGWWEMNNIRIRLKRRARWLVGYGQSPVWVRPDFERGIPVYEEINPLNTFPNMSGSPADVTPDDVILANLRTFSWIEQRFPDKAHLIANEHTRPDDLFEVLDWLDADELVMVVIGERRVQKDQFSPPERVSLIQELQRVPNRAGVCPIVVPGRVTLGRNQGMVDSLYGIFIKQAKLDALEYIALREQVFPEEWESSHPGERLKVNREANAKLGIRGQIQGGQIVRMSPDPTILAANNVVDRLERNSRVIAGAPPQFGGETPTNVRTGRANTLTLEASIDFPIQEHQELLALSLREENRRAVKTAKGYFGDTKKSFYVPWRGVNKNVSYTPNTDFKTEESHVSYFLAGLDAAQYPVAIGQRMGLGTMSRFTAMENDPIVSDPEFERDQVVAEAIEAAGLQMVQAAVADGRLSPRQWARIKQLVIEQGSDLAAAILQAQEEEQERQAAQQQAQPGSPASQPGLDQQGELVNQQVQGPLDELGNLMFALRSGGRGAA